MARELKKIGDNIDLKNIVIHQVIKEQGCVKLFSRESRWYLPQEIYAYLLGLLDMKTF